MGNELTISLVVYNGEKYIPSLFDSLKKQNLENYELVVLDNASADKTMEKVAEFCPHDIAVQMMKKEKNIGFAGGHNEVFKNLHTEYFLILNQDIFLAPDVLEKLVNFLDTHLDVAAVAPRLNKWDFANHQLTDNIDTLGLQVLKNRRVIEKKDLTATKSRNNGFIEVFGLSGACAMYRKSAIDKVGGLFDEDYFTYKEDVDLSYRLRQAGFRSFVLLGTTGWHDRTGSEKGKSDFAQAQNKIKQSQLVKYYSYRNHLMNLYKNEYWQNFIIDFPLILWYELKKFVWFLCFDRQVLKALTNIWEMRKKLKVKRHEIKKMRVLNWRQFRALLKSIN